MEHAKYTAEENALRIPCRVWVPSENRAQLVDILALPFEALTIDVIAHSLAQSNRFNGHTPFPYSVALHSILVSLLLPKGSSPALLLEALLHDAAEAYVGDVIHPVKRELPAFRPIEAAADAQLRYFYNLPKEESPVVKAADTKALWVEQFWLQGKNYSCEALEILTIDDHDLGWFLCKHPSSWQVARDAFVGTYSTILAEICT